MKNRILAELEREWAQLEASPAAVRSLTRWIETEPALAGCVTGNDILAKRMDPSAAPAVLAALSRLAASGDELATRALLQALVPGLVTLATGPLAGDPGALDELLSLAWERIRTYPTWRPGSVAANVLWDVRKRYRKHRAIDEPVHTASRQGPLPVTPSAEDVALKRSCVDDIRAAHRAGVIGDVAIHLILRTRLDGLPLAEAAAEHRASAEWANCVRWRAERRLRPVLAEAS